MPENNQYRHQIYPTHPVQPVELHLLQHRPEIAGAASALHTQLGVDRVILVHGTFLGDDPLGLAGSLRALSEGAPRLATPLQSMADRLQERTRPAVSAIARDLGNYTAEFCDTFQRLVGDDPQVELLEPTWSGENHAFARLDLAVRIVQQLLLRPLPEGRRVMLWGHSHAGNAFAILTNLLAGGASEWRRICAAAGNPREEHWRDVEQEMLRYQGPHPLAGSLYLVTFGTPVRYGWDTLGFRDLLHVSFHRVHDESQPELTQPLFPMHSAGDVTGARWGDWVQAFALAGTDVSSLQKRRVNEQLNQILESGLEPPEHALDTRLIVPARLRDLCARLKLGVRCHTDGLNLLVDYEQSGEVVFPGIPIEKTVMGHGVATTVTWLPAHLHLVLNTLQTRNG